MPVCRFARPGTIEFHGEETDRFDRTDGRPPRICGYKHQLWRDFPIEEHRDRAEPPLRVRMRG